MKNLLVILSLITSIASYGGNLVVNGGFEDENFTTETPYEWEPDFKAVKSLPGWTLNALDVWNMALSLYSHEYMNDYDGKLIKEGNTNFAFMRRFQNNAWETGRFSQIVKGLEVGQEYYLDALVCQNNGTAPGCSDFSHGFKIKENNENGKQIFVESYAAQEGNEWFRYERKFTATSSEIYLEIYYANPWRGGEGQGKTDDSWFAIDNVMIYHADEYDEMHPDPVEEPDPVDPSTIDYTNHVANGDFESEDYEYNLPYEEWEPDFRVVTDLPGWKLGSGLDPWNMALTMFAHNSGTSESELISEDNKQFAFFRRYKENAWATGSIYQIIDGLETGKEYYLDALVCQNDGEAPGCSDFSHGFIVNDGNADGQLIFRENSAAQNGVDWFRYERKFKARSEKIYLEVYYVNPWRGGEGQGETHNSWFSVDNVKIYDANAYEYFHNAETSIEKVSAEAENNIVLGVYNIQGIRLCNTVEELIGQKGLFIVRTASGAKKIIL